MTRDYNLAIKIGDKTISITLGYIDNGTVRVVDYVEDDFLIYENYELKSVDSIISQITKMLENIQTHLELFNKLNPISSCFIISSKNMYFLNYNTDLYYSGEDKKFTLEIAKKLNDDLYRKIKPKVNNTKICTALPYLYIVDQKDRYNLFPIDLKGESLSFNFNAGFADNEIVDRLSSVGQRLFDNSTIYLTPFSIQEYLKKKPLDSIGNDYLILDVDYDHSSISIVNKNDLKVSKLLNYGLSNIVDLLAAKFNLSEEMCFSILKNYGLVNTLEMDFEIPGTNIRFGMFNNELKSYLERFKNLVSDAILQITTDFKKIDSYQHVVLTGLFNEYKGFYEYLKNLFSYELVIENPNIPGPRIYDSEAVIGAFYCMSKLNWEHRKNESDFTLTKTLNLSALRKDKED